MFLSLSLKYLHTHTLTTHTQTHTHTHTHTHAYALYLSQILSHTHTPLNPIQIWSDLPWGHFGPMSGGEGGIAINIKTLGGLTFQHRQSNCWSFEMK